MEMIEAEAAMPGLEAEETLRKDFSYFDPESVYRLAMMAFDDKQYANKMRCERIEQKANVTKWDET